MKLIVNADDFGYSRGVNEGIMKAFHQGIVTSTSLMVNQEATDHALELLTKGDTPAKVRGNTSKHGKGTHLQKREGDTPPSKKCPQPTNKLLPGTGIHLCITRGRPASPVEQVPSLVDSAGNFKNPTAYYSEPVNMEEVVNEFQAQLLKVASQGINITHLDTHHHIHLHPVVLQAVIAVALAYKLPVRSVNEEMKNTLIARGIPTPEHFCADWFGDGVSFMRFKKIITTARKNSFTLLELMTHPGIVDQTLIQISSYKDGRVKELEILCNSKTREFLKKMRVELCDYNSLST